jgi:glycosyltransferase involved in cell wall biosynthesis
MPGILHIHPARCDFQTQRCLETITNNLGREWPMHALSIGRGGDLGNLAYAVYRLRRDGWAENNIAHTWCPGGLVAAAAAGFTRIIFSPQGPIAPVWAPWIRTIIARANPHIVCPTSHARDFFVALGAMPGRCQVIPPPVDLDRLNGRDSRLRQRLGFSDSDWVVLAPGESTREASHKLSLWAIAILNVLETRWRLLIWGRGAMVDPLRRFVDSTMLDNLLVNAEQRLGEPIAFESLTSAADAALEFGQGMSPVLPVETCMAAGVPIVAATAPGLRGVFRNGVNAVFEEGATPRRLAQRLLALRKDRDLQQMIATAAAAQAKELFSPALNLEQWRTAYPKVGESRPQTVGFFRKHPLVETGAMHYI